MQVRAVFLDDIMQQPDLPELDMVADYETRSLRCGTMRPKRRCGGLRFNNSCIAPQHKGKAARQQHTGYHSYREPSTDFAAAGCVLPLWSG